MFCTKFFFFATLTVFIECASSEEVSGLKQYVGIKYKRESIDGEYAVVFKHLGGTDGQIKQAENTESTIHLAFEDGEYIIRRQEGAFSEFGYRFKEDSDTEAGRAKIEEHEDHTDVKCVGSFGEEKVTVIYHFSKQELKIEFFVNKLETVEIFKKQD